MIAGVDEVGRGCLAGPVVCAAVILPEEHESWMDEIRDSKKLTANKREILANLIFEKAIWSIREGGVNVIEDLNILAATLYTMKRAVQALSVQPDLVLVDGDHRIPDLGLPQECIKGGDNINKAIGAASIIAKVYRDKMMSIYHTAYPEYGWERNKGYGTEEHRQAIMEHGITDLHRKTFKGVTEYA
jgi:ribonuclease HII